MALFKSLTRIWAVVRKDLIEVLRRPAAVISLVLGPFLIMAIFGAGYSGAPRPLITVLVIAANSGLSTNLADYQSLAGGGFVIERVTQDQASAMQELVLQQVDLVVVAPADPDGAFRAGQQSVIKVFDDVVDPVRANYANFLAGQLSAVVNNTIIQNALAAGENQTLRAAPGAQLIPATVLAEPTRVETSNIAPSQPGVVAFFGPAVAALIIQHMGVTLTALSLVRERLSGVMEVFRISPTGALELLIGKYIAFGLLNAAIASVVMTLIVKVLGVPFLGDTFLLAGVIGLLILASLGLGLFISVVSDSERQAVQLSLLVLLASVFFGGFVLSIDEFVPAVRTAAYVLPVTHGIQLFQDLLLRGSTTSGWEIGALAAIAGVLFLATWMLLRRSMAHG